ncbi:MAG: hypothetical protein E6Q54_21335 [Mycolicibacter arupensis]|uniref:Uncharacterized protein n=1 Tax=Mycolicibacter arupensis TaxID=342002 RepID=A0A5C7XMX6_9MYCO|nr:MAG: hypothetical protein E6Q54_21335 [Mycolicibacter arupensis]
MGGLVQPPPHQQLLRRHATGRIRSWHPHPDGLHHQLNLDHTNPTLETGGLRNGDSPKPSTTVSTEPRKPLSSQTRERPETPGGFRLAHHERFCSSISVK